VGGGANFVEEMQAGITTARRMIAVLSEDYLDSQFTAPEWQAAFAADPKGESQRLVPIRVRACELTGLLPQIVFIDLVGKNQDDARAEVLSRISGLRAKPDNPPGFPGLRERLDQPADVFSLGMTALFGLYAKDLPIDAFRETRSFIDQLDCTRPVRAVMKKATEWVQSKRYASMGEFLVDLETASSLPDGADWPDEEEELSDTTLVKRLTRDIEAAHRIQEFLLPASAPECPGFDIAGACYPAEQCSGDYFDYIPNAWREDGDRDR
jgi:hypothetical protein